MKAECPLYHAADIVTERGSNLIVTEQWNGKHSYCFVEPDPATVSIGEKPQRLTLLSCAAGGTILWENEQNAIGLLPGQIRVLFFCGERVNIVSNNNEVFSNHQDSVPPSIK